jgi:hypothetical protein
MENLLEKKKEAFVVPDTAEYELNIDAPEKCSSDDVNEPISYKLSNLKLQVILMKI